MDPLFSGLEVTEAVEQLCSGPGVDEIHPESLKALDVWGLSWLTHFCNIAWTMGALPFKWQTGVVVPIFEKGDQKMCSNYRGDHTPQPPWEGLCQGWRI